MCWNSFLMWVEAHKTFTTAATSIVVTFLTLSGGLLVGQKLSAKWNMRVKEREDDLAAIHSIRELYGELLTTRRLWNLHFEAGKPKIDDTRRVQLLDRASAAESAMEAILMKAAFERELCKNQQDQLGLLRQGFQQLRECIRDLVQLRWGYSEHPEYVAVKHSTHALIVVIAQGVKKIMGPEQFEYITSNVHERRWDDLTRNSTPPGPKQ